ncbi:MAG TPA: anhydro-N-acetylmuramic acid kinase [Thermoflexales bacterium]|nr:anhydro-N-acetylmuramic acid kinase [Thermoflexales bacterium]HRA00901.1 anhydro-N-acetylmuramic acid kinase [Thermoflexales bacterium]
MIVIGLMSGTSADGIDAAVVKLERDHADAGLRWQLLKHINLPFEQALRDEILACCAPATASVDRVCALNAELGEAYAAACFAAAQEAGLSISQIDLIGSHGQTVWHIPAKATLQIGAAAVIAERTGVTTVSDFRSRDIAAGGQGAPLVAYVDALLFTHPTKRRALQNIGGIGNVTFLPAGHFGDGNAPGLAFDTGPGNMMMDYAAEQATNGAWRYDEDGQLARRGRVDGALLEELMDHDFIRRDPPKTTGREEFGAFFARRMCNAATARGAKAEDIVATFTAFTALSIADAYRRFLPAMPEEVFVSGGGALNPALMDMLRAEMPSTRITTSDELNMPAAAKEAVCFAALAYETIQNRPGNLPSATGAKRAVVLGSITPGNHFTAETQRRGAGNNS